MKRKWFATLAGLMCIAFWGALPSISLAKEGEWTKKADMPTARQDLSTSVVDGKIYAIGGFDGVSALSTVEAYDPRTDKWTKKADMPTARAGLSTSVVDGKIYAIGGVSFVVAEFSTVEEYDTGLPQSVNPAGKFPTLWGKVKVGK